MKRSPRDSEAKEVGSNERFCRVNNSDCTLNVVIIVKVKWSRYQLQFHILGGGRFLATLVENARLETAIKPRVVVRLTNSPAVLYVFLSRDQLRGGGFPAGIRREIYRPGFPVIHRLWAQSNSHATAFLTAILSHYCAPRPRNGHSDETVGRR